MEKALSDFGQIFSGKLDRIRWTIYFPALEYKGSSSVLTRMLF